MKYHKKYFIWNKISDFTRGSSQNIQLLSPGITIQNVETGTGIFFSRLLDSREKQTIYHRILVEGEEINEATVHIRVYASESSKIKVKGEMMEIGEILTDSSISCEEKQELFSPFCQKVMAGPKDLLLHEVTGRYLWLQVSLIGQGYILPKITKIKVIFPKDSWIKYLPDLYQEDTVGSSFVERYLGMFQSLYEDLTEQIENVPRYLNPEAAQGEFLEWLATWISLEDVHLWKEEQLRYLLKHSIELYRKRGTVAYLLEMVKLYTGKVPYLVEHHKMIPYQENQKYSHHLLNLYGDNPYIFTLIVHVDRQMNNKEYQILTKIVEESKPVHMECKIVVLQPYIFLDRYSYLGVNSVLGNYGSVVLDGQSSIPFAVLRD